MATRRFDSCASAEPGFCISEHVHSHHTKRDLAQWRKLRQASWGWRCLRRCLGLPPYLVSAPPFALRATGKAPHCRILFSGAARRAGLRTVRHRRTSLVYSSQSDWSISDEYRRSIGGFPRWIEDSPYWSGVLQSPITGVRVDNLSEVSTIIPDFPRKGPERSGGFAATISRNIVASLARVAVVSLVALVLPAYLTHHLPVETYAAWILILQLGAYVPYLDLGIQTGVSKFVAEYDARGDETGAGRHASAGFALMMLAGILGLGLTLVLAWQVPLLFSAMPANLYHDVRISVMLVGSSLSFGLVCAVYSAVFLGLQRYWIPMTISVVNRASFAAIVLAVVALHGSLAAMGIAVALVNVVTGLLQVVAWRKKASHIRISTGLVDYRVLKNM